MNICGSTAASPVRNVWYSQPVCGVGRPDVNAGTTSVTGSEKSQSLVSVVASTV